MNEPSYFGLTNDHTWLSVDAEYYKKLKPTHRMKCYTNPVKELTDEEILDLCPPNHSDMMNEAYTIEFAKAILRKARND